MCTEHSVGNNSNSAVKNLNYRKIAIKIKLQDWHISQNILSYRIEYEPQYAGPVLYIVPHPQNYFVVVSLYKICYKTYNLIMNTASVRKLVNKMTRNNE